MKTSLYRLSATDGFKFRIFEEVTRADGRTIITTVCVCVCVCVICVITCYIQCYCN